MQKEFPVITLKPKPLMRLALAFFILGLAMFSFGIASTFQLFELSQDSYYIITFNGLLLMLLGGYLRECSWRTKFQLELKGIKPKS